MKLRPVARRKLDRTTPHILSPVPRSRTFRPAAQMLPRAYQKHLFDDNVVGLTIRRSFPLRRRSARSKGRRGRRKRRRGFSRKSRRLIRFHQRSASARVKLIFIGSLDQEMQVLYQERWSIAKQARSRRRQVSS